MFKRIWKDPVWSGVISAAIITTFGFMVMFIYSLVTDKPVKDSILYLWNLKINLGSTLVVVFSLAIVVRIIVNLLKSKPSKKQRLEKIFHNKFNKIVDEENKITYRFNAYIDEFTNYPFISDLRIYCNEHESESLISHIDGCRRPGCNKLRKGYDERFIKPEIETSLLKIWEDMKSSTT